MRTIFLAITGLFLFLNFSQAAVKPFELNPDRTKVSGKSSFAATKTYIIPTVYVRITARTQTEISSEGSSGASVKAKILVDNLDKKSLQAAAAKIAEDLEKKIKDAGYEVIPYSAVQADLKSISKMKPNEKFGFPTNIFEGASGVDFAIITPSDDRTFDFGMTGSTFAYRDLAKAKKAVVIVPEIRLTLTEVTGETGANIFKATASLNILPTMHFDWGLISALDPSASVGNIVIQRHGKRPLTDAAGTVKKISEDNNSYAGWSRTVGDFSFTVDKDVVSNSVVAAGSQVNDFIVKTIKDAQ
jgi:hypothetical protein